MSHNPDDPSSSALKTLSAAAESPELRQYYLQNLVHELSTPLTPLIGYLKLFRNQSLGKLTDLQGKCLDRMDHATRRLTAIIEDLSYLLQLESGVYRVDPRPVAIAQVLEQALASHEAGAQDDQIDVITDISLGEDLQVTGDTKALRLAIEHLLANALKFNSAGGKLLVRAGVAESGGQKVVRIELFDSGIGIPAADKDRVFEPFFQCDHKTTRRFGGAGLGLPLVRWIMGLHDGTIRLESPPGVQPDGHFFRGVRAVVELPVAQAP